MSFQGSIVYILSSPLCSLSFVRPPPYNAILDANPKMFYSFGVSNTSRFLNQLIFKFTLILEQRSLLWTSSTLVIFSEILCRKLAFCVVPLHSELFSIHPLITHSILFYLKLMLYPAWKQSMIILICKNISGFDSLVICSQRIKFLLKHKAQVEQWAYNQSQFK